MGLVTAKEVARAINVDKFGFVGTFIGWSLMKVLKISTANKIYDRNKHLGDLEFLNALLDEFFPLTLNPSDSDIDGIPDHLDLESTNPANIGAGPFDLSILPDAALLDLNNDGLIDNIIDEDGDGLASIVDNAPNHFGSIEDHDNDGISNRLDLDDDNDGIPDLLEGSGLIDTDLDNEPDSSDLDSDNDGIPDLKEGQTGLIDDDNNGVVDNIIDANNDGLDDLILNSFMTIDTDHDGTPDFQDLDSDDDQIFDLIEANLPTANLSLVDSNNDGQVDTIIDNGLPTPTFVPVDFDLDGYEDYIDIDSDNDGFTDALENGDHNQNGINDRFETNEDKFETAKQGAGSINTHLLFVISLLLVWRYQISVKFLLLLVLLPLFIHPERALAENQKCAFFSSSITHNNEDTLSHKDNDFTQEFHPCWYGAVGIGLGFLDPDGTGGWSTEEEKSFGADIHLGFHFAPHWLTELNYTYIGDAKLNNVNQAISKDVDGSISYYGPSVMLGYQLLPESKPFNYYLKAGATSLQTNASDARIKLDKVSSMQFSFSTGIQYRFDSSPWFINIEYQSFAKDAALFGTQIGRYFGYRNRKPRFIPLESANARKRSSLKADGDQDGVYDHLDLCPHTILNVEVGTNGCCLEKDNCKVIFEQ